MDVLHRRHRLRGDVRRQGRTFSEPSRNLLGTFSEPAQVTSAAKAILSQKVHGGRRREARPSQLP